MSILVIAEHDNASLKAASLNAVRGAETRAFWIQGPSPFWCG